MASTSLKKEFKFYLEHKKDLIKKYKGRFIVIKNNEVIGSYDSKIEAYEESKKENELGTFLIQYVDKGDESHTATFYSRVSV